MAFVALGSNLGHRADALRSATRALHEAVGTSVLAASPVFETPAHTRPPHHPQPPYLNAVLKVATMRAPAALVKLLLGIEAAQGRTRTEAWAARLLDLDLLLYGDRVLDTPLVTVPHPRLHLRRFVLEPLAALAPGLWLPAPHHATVHALRTRCPDADRPVPTDIDLLDGL